MSFESLDVPDFVREAEGGDFALDRLDADALSALPAILPSASTAGRARLIQSVEELPLRYAPFFDRLGALWRLPEAEVRRVLERARDARAWRKPGLPGLRVLDVIGGPGLGRADVRLVHFAPGMRFPVHRHVGPEAVLVLEGSYRDVSGRVLGPGDLHEMTPESSHEFRVASGAVCVAASVQFGIEFTGPVMKILMCLFGGA